MLRSGSCPPYPYFVLTSTLGQSPTLGLVDLDVKNFCALSTWFCLMCNLCILKKTPTNIRTGALLLVVFISYQTREANREHMPLF